MEASAKKSRSFAFHLLEINLAVLFISTSGVLGRYIDLPTPITIAMRALIAGVLLFLFCKWKKFDFQVKGRDRWAVLAGGILMAIHWLTYFYALQLSNVAIGMLSLFTYPAFTTLLEPLFLKTKFLPFHLLTSALVLFGVFLLAPDFDVQSDSFKAVGFGVLSGLCYAFRNILLKPTINRYNGSVLMVYQMAIVGIGLAPFFFILEGYSLVQFLPETLVLALLTTAIGHTLFLYSLRHFSTVTASIVSCTQPVYGILIGMLFLQEYPGMKTILGGGIIVLTVLAESIRLGQAQKTG